MSKAPAASGILRDFAYTSPSLQFAVCFSVCHEMTCTGIFVARLFLCCFFTFLCSSRCIEPVLYLTLNDSLLMHVSMSAVLFCVIFSMKHKRRDYLGVLSKIAL